MSTVRESVHVGASLGESWALYFEPSAWPAWVDGFDRVEASEGYPHRGGTLRWRSTPAGRGTVVERVLEHEPRRIHRVAFSDPESEGELVTRFEIEAGSGAEPGTRVAQELTYRLRERGVLTPLTDVIFIRPQVGRSVRRSLERFRAEAEGIAAEGE
jgi:Polyketide cyclase / dehydrase and lipid transport